MVDVLRMQRFLAIALLTLLAAGCPGKDKKSVETPRVASESEFQIDFESYTLDNGLTVILHKDTSDPIVAMATVVHVGSSREKPGRTGFAHFFEHMSFNNSENVPMGANRKMIPELGGTRNGGTWEDATIYFEVVPKDAFEKLMWIDSDRFGYMINTVKEGTLEREKQVVKNEKRQRVDNRAYGHTGHVIKKALYPEGHPYNWTVIGDLEDLQSATLDDVREFYERFYVPANATLVIAGDIDFAETRALVESWFGEIKAGSPVADMKVMPVTLDADKKLFHLDGFAKTAEIRLTFPTVEQYHLDSYALDALGAILASGKTAPLFTTIVMDAKQSSSVSAYQDSGELAGTFTIRVRANPGMDLDEVHASIEKSLARFESEGFRAEDLQRFQAKSETALYGGVASVLDKALKLGIYQEFAGDPGFLDEERKRVQELTREDVLRVYEKYIKGKPAVITSFVPKDQPALALEGSSKAAVVEEKIVAGAEKEFVESDADDFARTPSRHDRSEPPLGAKPLPRVPAIWTSEQSNGVKVVGIEHRELPLVEFSLRIDGGQRLDTKEALGSAMLAASMLNEGTQNKTPVELQDAIELLGASLFVYGDATGVHVQGRTLAKNFDATIALMTEMLLEPRWDGAEFERLKTRRLARIKEREGNPRAVAALAFSRQLYGDEHIGGQPAGGTTESVSAIELEDLKAWYGKNLSPGNATLHVVGAVTSKKVDEALARLSREWTGEALRLPELPEIPKARAQLFFVDIPGSKQSVIYMGRPALRGDDPRFYRMTVANNRLGSGSSARLTQKLRIEKGYTYGAYSSVQRKPYQGAFVASSQVRSNVTMASLEIFKDLVGNYAKTFGAEHLATTKNLISKGDTRRFETLAALLRVLETMSEYDLPHDYIQKQSAELEALSLEELHKTMGELLVMEEMSFVVVGDAKTQLKGLEGLGYGKPILLDRQGKRL
jgi:zinc protease